jgi:hypothetical protein
VVYPGGGGPSLPRLIFWQDQSVAPNGVGGSEHSSDRARHLARSAPFGAIAPGRKADLVLLRANPLGDASAIESLS